MNTQTLTETIRVLADIVKNPVGHSKEVIDAADKKILELIQHLGSC